MIASSRREQEKEEEKEPIFSGLLTELSTPSNRHRDEANFRRTFHLSSGIIFSILRFRLFWRGVIVFVASAGAAVSLIAPYYQKAFVDGVNASSSLRGVTFDWAGSDPRVAIVFAFLAMLIGQGLGLLVKLLSSREAAIVNEHLSQALYEHTLKLTSRARSDKTVGEMVSLYAQDVNASSAVLEDFFASLIGCLAPIIIAPVFINLVFGIPVTNVVMVIGACLSVLMVLSWRQSGFFGIFKRLAAKRIAIVNEWLQNIRIIRILDWTDFFEAKIFKTRVEETANRVTMVTNGSAMNSLAQVAPLLINVVGIITLVRYLDRPPTPGDIFGLMWVFGVFLARPLRNIPWTLVMYLDGYSSAQRLEEFFSLPVEKSSDGQESSIVGDNAAAPALDVSGLSLELGGRKIFKNVSFVIPQGSFVAITGDVGSGKSQLLLSLLCDSTAIFKVYKINGRNMQSLSPAQVRKNFLYVPQDGFVMSAPLRKNIEFDYNASSSASEDLIFSSLRAADFDPKTESLEAGVSSEIGERGVNLSGGQRQRVGLARAHFFGEKSRAETQKRIILLDDSLSAVDTNTESRIVDQLICGEWKDHTRILVTHRLSVLSKADQVWNLHNGEIEVINGAS
jgi:ABC-type multidrug transport system fused ATPase/permease subunit